MHQCIPGLKDGDIVCACTGNSKYDRYIKMEVDKWENIRQVTA